MIIITKHSSIDRYKSLYKNEKKLHTLLAIDRLAFLSNNMETANARPTIDAKCSGVLPSWKGSKVKWDDLRLNIYLNLKKNAETNSGFLIQKA